MLKDYINSKNILHSLVKLNVTKDDLKYKVRNMEDFLYLMNSVNNPELDKETLMNICMASGDKMPLPSGRYGNALGVLLEMHKYEIALDILNDSENYSLDIERVSYVDGDEAWNAEETFNFSLISFEEDSIRKKPTIQLREVYSSDEVDELIKKEVANATAAEEIAKKFSR